MAEHSPNEGSFFLKIRCCPYPGNFLHNEDHTLKCDVYHQNQLESIGEVPIGPGKGEPKPPASCTLAFTDYEQTTLLQWGPKRR